MTHYGPFFKSLLTDKGVSLHQLFEGKPFTTAINTGPTGFDSIGQGM